MRSGLHRFMDPSILAGLALPRGSVRSWASLRRMGRPGSRETCKLCSAITAGGASHSRAHPPSSGSAVPRAEIRTAETVITLEAGAEAPRMTGLALRGTSPWLNQAVEALPAQVGL